MKSFTLNTLTSPIQTMEVLRDCHVSWRTTHHEAMGPRIETRQIRMKPRRGRGQDIWMDLKRKVKAREKKLSSWRYWVLLLNHPRPPSTPFRRHFPSGFRSVLWLTLSHRFFVALLSSFGSVSLSFFYIFFSVYLPQAFLCVRRVIYRWCFCECVFVSVV